MAPLLTVLARFESRQECALPRLLVLSDDARGFDLEAQQRLWPLGAAFVERTYGAQPSPSTRGTFQLATCTPNQARQAGHNGVHWPSKRLRFRRASQTQGLLETASAHSGLEIARANAAGIKCILISSAFASSSPTAKRPLGPIRLAKLARAFPDCALFALGGITHSNIAKLRRTGIYGVALVSFATANADASPR